MMKIQLLTASSEKTDVLHINLTAFIRCMEIARESAKSDNNLHVFIESLSNQRSENSVVGMKEVIQAETESGLSEK